MKRRILASTSALAGIVAVAGFLAPVTPAAANICQQPVTLLTSTQLRAIADYGCPIDAMEDNTTAAVAPGGPVGPGNPDAPGEPGAPGGSGPGGINVGIGGGAVSNTGGVNVGVGSSAGSGNTSGINAGIGSGAGSRQHRRREYRRG